MKLRFWSLVFTFSLMCMHGCKTNNTKKSSVDDTNSGKDSSLPFVVHGRVNSGSLLGKQVPVRISLHPLLKGEVVLSESVATVMSDSDGFYELTVAHYYLNQPAVISAQLPSINLNGEANDEEAVFQLLLSVPELSVNLTNNITVLTHLAAKKLLTAKNLGSSTQAALAISDANTQVASRFGVIGDLASTPIVNINESSEWTLAQSTSLRYSAMGVAILNASYSDSSVSMVIGDILEQFTSPYSVFGLVDNSANDQVTSYAEVLTELKLVLKGMSSPDEEVKVLNRLLIEVSTELGLAQAEEPDEYDRGTSASSVGLSLVDRAKLMVHDIRQIVSSIDIQSIAGLSNISKLIGSDDPISDKLDGFGIQVNLAGLTQGEDFDHITAALKLVGVAILDQLTCSKKQNCDELEPTPIHVDHTVNVIRGGSSGTVEIHEFRVKQMVDGCVGTPLSCYISVDLIVSLDATKFQFSSTGNEIWMAAAKITMNGSISENSLTLYFDSKTPQVELNKLYLGMQETVAGNIVTDLTNVTIEAHSTVLLPLVLSKDSPEGLEEMRLNLEVKFDKVELDLLDTTQTTYYGSQSTTTKTSDIVVHELVGLEVNVSGVVNESQEENFLVSVNVAQPGRGFSGLVTYRQTSVEDCLYSSSPSSCTKTDLDSDLLGESTDLNEDGTNQFLRMDASVGYKAILKGVADPVIIQLSASRETPEQNEINGLKVNYPGHSLSLKGTFTPNGYITSMGATNLDGIVMEIDSDDKGKRRGFLMAPDGQKLADIRPASDLVHITFIDGFFTTF